MSGAKHRRRCTHSDPVHEASMFNSPLPSSEIALGQLNITGLDLVPAGLAALVLATLGATLVITALRRRYLARDRLVPEDERALR